MVYPDNKTVLYVSGFGIDLRARDLAYEFERYGRLVRCDIPALKSAQSLPFAFVEFRRPDDAEDAYYDMHGRAIDGRRITVQWAKRPPSTAWRHDGGVNGDRGPRPYSREEGRGGYDDRRGGGFGSDRPRSPLRRASPPRRDYEDRPRDVARDADRGRDYDRSPRRDISHDDRRGRSASPRRGSASGDRAHSPRGAGNGDRLRSQSPPRGAAYAGADEEKRDSRDD